jgi:aryl-alcohol dehydrogenase-like predicted oxidoreductase
MKYVRMGSTGTQVSRLCLGCMSFGGMADWTLDAAGSLPIIRKAVEAGINFFDTADVYSRGQSEEIIGAALKELGVRREESVVATKVFNPMGRGPNRGGLSRKHIHQSIDASLQRLGMDYVDLYQIHRFDYDTPIEETIEALDDVVKAGKALYIGASSMFAYQFSKYLLRADASGRTRFTMMQNHYNLLYREEEREMNPLCLEEGVGLIPWSPLAGGVLAGSREAGTTRSKSAMGRGRYNRPADQAVLDALKSVADQRGETPAQVAIAWLLSKPAVTAPIVGATKAHQLDDPLKAVEAPVSAEVVGMVDGP